MAHQPVCQLCGHESRDVKVSLVRWREPVREHDYFDRVARCLDVERCFRRVLDAGEPWPVDDGRVPVA